MVAEPRLLIVSVKASGVDFVAVSVHGPLADDAECTVVGFWEHVRSSVSDQAGQRAVVLLADANATMAEAVDGCVVEVVSGKFSQTSAAFGNFLSDSALWLPATFAAFGDAVLGTSYNK